MPFFGEVFDHIEGQIRRVFRDVKPEEP